MTASVFGLGNRQYEHFNSAGRAVERALAAMGAAMLLPIGLGDDDGTLEDDFASWRKALWGALEAKFPGVARGDAKAREVRASLEEEGKAPAAAYEVEVAPKGAPAPRPRAAGQPPFSSHNPYLARAVRALALLPPDPSLLRVPQACAALLCFRTPLFVVLFPTLHLTADRARAQTVVRELHSGGGRSCLHVELDISGMGAKYEAGDHVAILPENSPAAVEEAARLLGLPLDTVFTLRETPGLPTPFAGPTDLRQALAREADLLSPPRKSALAALAAAAADAAEAERLRHLASPSGKADFASFVSEPQRSLLEVMRAFPSAKPSLGVFFAAVAPRLAPRFYSISSSPRLHPRSVHVTAAVVRGETPTGRVHEGVCTTWLVRIPNGAQCANPSGPAFLPSLSLSLTSHLTLTASGPRCVRAHETASRLTPPPSLAPRHALPGASAAPAVPLYLRTSQFRLPQDFSKPVVMVGPGTGLAPFRGFLQERAELAKAGCALGKAVLFFGCRSERHDYIYREELEGAVASGAVNALHVAFSRDQEGRKVYVQHLLREQGAEVWALLGKGGFFYVCGDAKGMAKDVHRALEEVVQKHGGMSFAEAEAFMKRLQTEGRYQRDVW